MASSQDIRPVLATTAIAALLIGSSSSWLLSSFNRNYRTNDEKVDNNDNKNDADSSSNSGNSEKEKIVNDDDDDDGNDIYSAVLPCIRNRQSIFPNSYLKDPPTPIDKSIIQSLLDAAIWSPFHGRCYKDSQHPAKFVILGKKSMVEMQKVTLEYYDTNWEKVGWGSSSIGTKEEYLKWRKMTEDEITGRWGPVEYMIAIVMRRQSTPSKRLPEWEEIAAVATSVQNMHIQACAATNTTTIKSKSPTSTQSSSSPSSSPLALACYWSSWHSAVCDSTEMKQFLNFGDGEYDDEDRCMGFFMVAQKDPLRCSEKDRRKRDKSLLAVEWRE